MQLYKGFDIGTAKVSKEIRNRIPHHLLDAFDIDEDCTASKYISIAVPIVSCDLKVNSVHLYHI